MKISVNGRSPRVETLAQRATVNFGHFTSMQVRQGSVRGLDKHLARLAAATEELFDTELDQPLVRSHLRRAISGSPDSTARVDVFPDFGGQELAVMVTVSASADTSPTPASLKSVSYERPVAHIKHAGGFAQIYHRTLAQKQGFDEALLTDGQGNIAETAIANIGFLSGRSVIWPDRPALHGIAWQLLDEHLPEHGYTTERRRVTLSDLADFDAAFIANSTGVVPVARIDSTILSSGSPSLRHITRLYEKAPWQLV